MTAVRVTGWLGCGMAVIAIQLAWSPVGFAAADSKSQEGVKIEPYTGPPIYLEETQQLVKPKIVSHETIKEKYEDEKTLRVEREVAHYSDNNFAADGKYKEYHPNGKPFVEGQFTEGRQEGNWTYYFENGQLNRKASYKDGKPDGSWEVFSEDGKLAAKRSFKDGLRDGDWITYDDAGKQPLIEEHYTKGEEDGTWKIFFPSGKLKQQVGFKAGKRDGTSTEWDEKGQKVAEAMYTDGKLNGTATRWLPDGRKIVQTYKDNKFVSETKE